MNNSNNDQKNQVSQLNAEISAQIHSDFLSHPYAKKFIIELTSQKDLLLNECMNLSLCSPVDMDTIKTKLVRAKQITETIKYVETIRPA